MTTDQAWEYREGPMWMDPTGPGDQPTCAVAKMGYIVRQHWVQGLWIVDIETIFPCSQQHKGHGYSLGTHVMMGGRITR